MESIINFIEKLYNSIRYNGFYILMSLFFPVVIWKFDAGSELFKSMGEQPVNNILFSLSAFTALCFSVWAVPVMAIRFFTWVLLKKAATPEERRELELKYYSKIIAMDNRGEENSQIPNRYFAILPWIFFILQASRIYFGNTAAFFIGAGLIGCIVLIHIYSKYFFIVMRLPRFLIRLFGEKKEWLGMIFLSLQITVPLILSLTLNGTQRTNNSSMISLVAVNCIGLLFFYICMFYLEKNEWVSTERQFKISKFIHIMLLVYTVSMVILYYFFNANHRIQRISPVFVITNMCTALIVFLELFVTSQFFLIYISLKKMTGEDLRLTPEQQSRRFRVYKFVLILFVFLILRVLFFSSFNDHRIRTTASTPATDGMYNERKSLREFFINWEKERDSASKQDSVIYLVSAQGGGSRAAAWAFINLARLDANTPHFFNNLFSVSTVSGSSSGANMYLAAKYYGFPVADSSAVDLYGVNYMSSAFYGLLIGDNLEGIIDIFDHNTRDRNYHLQEEEEAAFDRVYDSKDINRFFINDYMFPYRRHFPMFMINTTLLDFGTRAVFSPVKMNDFSMARDMYGEFRKDNCNTHTDLPMVACVNQSQAFPILSSYNYMECTGRIGDGGFSENSGCGTTLEIYRALRKYCDSMPGYEHYKIVCINMMNSDMSDATSAPFSKASAFTTATAAMRSPFDGNQNYAYKNLGLQMDYMKKMNRLPGRDTFYNFNLDTSITLTRTLSRNAVKIMLNKDRNKNYRLTESPLPLPAKYNEAPAVFKMMRMMLRDKM